MSTVLMSTFELKTVISVNVSNEIVVHLTDESHVNQNANLGFRSQPQSACFVMIII